MEDIFALSPFGWIHKLISRNVIYLSARVSANAQKCHQCLVKAKVCAEDDDKCDMRPCGDWCGFVYMRLGSHFSLSLSNTRTHSVGGAINKSRLRCWQSLASRRPTSNCFGQREIEKLVEKRSSQIVDVIVKWVGMDLLELSALIERSVLQRTKRILYTIIHKIK